MAMNPSTQAQDAKMRKEVLSTLKINPAAPFSTILGNWRYSQHGPVDEAAESRLNAILEEERVRPPAELQVEARPWWRFW